QGVERAGALRAAHRRRTARGAAGRVAARPRACPRVGTGVGFLEMADEHLAPMKEQVYKDPRPAEYFDRFHERARTREPDWVYEITRILTSLYAFTLLRARAIPVEHVPGRGAVILARNHFPLMAHLLMGCYLLRKVPFIPKS